MSFRTVFELGSRINWFPGHMVRSLKDMKDRLKLCHIVIEVRDARVPISSANILLDELITKQKRILVLNKQDLADSECTNSFLSYFENEGYTCIAQQTTAISNSKLISKDIANQSEKAKTSNHAKLIQTITRLSLELAQTSKFKSLPVVIGIVGLPNVGKSSLINSLRKHAIQTNALKGGFAQTGAKPGLTRHIRTFPLSKSPNILLMDTPGILFPASHMDEYDGLKLALTGCIKDTVAGEIIMADFLLFLFNLKKVPYEKLLQIQATDNVEDLLDQIARKKGLLISENRVQHQQAARNFIQQYRSGYFGKLTLDKVPINNNCLK